jgi:hypothetical protein
MEGVTLHPLKHITVPKGDIYHAMKSTDEGYCGFGEAYFSQIEQGQAKGWKRHNRSSPHDCEYHQNGDEFFCPIPVFQTLRDW